MTTYPVTLHVYDLSGGLAAQFAPALGIPIEGIWHTGVVVHGTEFYYGGGICADPPGRTPYGRPVSTHALGTTSVPRDTFLAHLRSVVAPAYTAASYHLLDHNCNHFSAAVVAYLCGDGVTIPTYISELPAVALASPLGGMLRQSLDGMQAQIRDASAGHELAGTGTRGGALLSASAPPPPTPSEETALARAVRTPVVAAVGSTPKILAALVAADPAWASSSSGGGANAGRPAVGDLLASLERAPSYAALDLLRLAAAEPGPRAGAVTSALPGLMATYAGSEGVDASPLRATSAAAAAAGCMMTLRAAVNVLAVEATARAILAATVPAVGGGGGGGGGRAETGAEQLADAVAPALGGPTGGVRLTGSLLARALARAAVHGWGGGEAAATAVVAAATSALGGSPRPPTDVADHLLTAVGLAVGGWPSLGGLVAATGVDVSSYGREGGVGGELCRLLEAVNGER